MNKDIIDELQSDWGQQRPDLNAEPMGVVLRIQALAKILGDQTAARLQEFELQWWQYDVLSTLRRQGDPYIMAATTLADSNMLTSGAMTALKATSFRLLSPTRFSDRTLTCYPREHPARLSPPTTPTQHAPHRSTLRVPLHPKRRS